MVFQLQSLLTCTTAPEKLLWTHWSRCWLLSGYGPWAFHHPCQSRCSQFCIYEDARFISCLLKGADAFVWTEFSILIRGFLCAGGASNFHQDDLDNVFGQRKSTPAQTSLQPTGDDPFALFGGLGTTQQAKQSPKAVYADDGLLGDFPGPTGKRLICLCVHAKDCCSAFCSQSPCQLTAKNNGHQDMKQGHQYAHGLKDLIDVCHCNTSRWTQDSSLHMLSSVLLLVVQIRHFVPNNWLGYYSGTVCINFEGVLQALHLSM